MKPAAETDKGQSCIHDISSGVATAVSSQGKYTLKSSFVTYDTRQDRKPFEDDSRIHKVAGHGERSHLEQVELSALADTSTQTLIVSPHIERSEMFATNQTHENLATAENANKAGKSVSGEQTGTTQEKGRRREFSKWLVALDTCVHTSGEGNG